MAQVERAKAIMCKSCYVQCDNGMMVDNGYLAPGHLLLLDHSLRDLFVELLQHRRAHEELERGEQRVEGEETKEK
jgi:Fe-S-cluster-containing hydrogenase component 2